jgi:hypothetical protein
VVVVVEAVIFVGVDLVVVAVGVVDDIDLRVDIFGDSALVVDANLCGSMEVN